MSIFICLYKNVETINCPVNNFTGSNSLVHHEKVVLIIETHLVQGALQGYNGVKMSEN